jgi:hypothetical protein
MARRRSGYPLILPLKPEVFKNPARHKGRLGAGSKRGEKRMSACRRQKLGGESRVEKPENRQGRPAPADGLGSFQKKARGFAKRRQPPKPTFE